MKDRGKEWTSDWLPVIALLEHKFGTKGEFVMEYSDFLEIFVDMDKSFLFDETWKQSSLWLNVAVRPAPLVCQYGDVSCAWISSSIATMLPSDVCSVTFTLTSATETILVLSQSDNRYYHDVAGSVRWNFDFKLFKAGQDKPIASSHAPPIYRSSNLRMKLESGDYVVHVSNLCSMPCSYSHLIPPVGAN